MSRSFWRAYWATRWVAAFVWFKFICRILIEVRSESDSPGAMLRSGVPGVEQETSGSPVAEDLEACCEVDGGWGEEVLLFIWSLEEGFLLSIVNIVYRF